MRTTKLRMKKAVVTLVLTAGVVVPAAMASAQPESHSHHVVKHADHADHRAGDKHHDDDIVDPSAGTSVWSDPSLIDNGGLKYG